MLGVLTQEIENFHRPARLTIISVVLGVLSLAGFGNAILWPISVQTHLGSDLSSTPTLQSVLAGISDRLPLMVLTNIASGITALLTALGAWHCKKWTPSAFLAWSVTVVIGAALFPTPQATVVSPLVSKILPVLILGIMVLAAYSFIKRAISTAYAK